MIFRPRDPIEEALETGRRRVLPETSAMAAIGCVDLLYTVYLVGTQKASEMNPLVAGIFNLTGPWGFVISKAALIGIPLGVAEYARRREERFTRFALRIGILLYLGFYAALWLRYNS